MASKSFIVLLLASLVLVARTADQNAPNANASSSSSTTPKSTTVATTSAPTPTTSTSTTTTTAKPPPVIPGFPDNIGNWTVIEANTSKPCMKLLAAMQFVVTFNTTKSSSVVDIDVPKNATVEGICGKNSSIITLKWPSSIEKKNNSLTIPFTLMNHDQDYSVPNISVVIIKDNKFSNASSTEPTSFNFTLNVTEGMFLTPTNRSFKCDAQTTLEDKEKKYVLKFAHLQMDAFRDTSSNKTDPHTFQKETTCSADRHSYAVGAGMIFMIIFIILLIVGVAGGGAYYYKKHKLPAGSGYENM